MLTLDILFEISKHIMCFKDEITFLDYLLSSHGNNVSLCNKILNDKRIFRPIHKQLKLDTLLLNIECGHYHMIELFHKKDKLPDNIYNLVIHYGSISMFNFIKNVLNIKYNHDEVMIAAARNQRWDTVRQLYTDASSKALNNIVHYIVKYKQVELLHAIYHKGMIDNITDAAMINNRLDILESFHSTSCYCEKSIYGAISRGHLEIVQWFVKTHGAKSAITMMEHASCHGELHILNFLYHCNQCKISEKTLDIAISRGQLHIIKWILKETPLKINSKNILLAASYNQINLIKVLGPKLPKSIICDMIDIAVVHNHVHMTRLLDHYIIGHIPIRPKPINTKKRKHYISPATKKFNKMPKFI